MGAREREGKAHHGHNKAATRGSRGGARCQALPDPAWHAIEAATQEMVENIEQVHNELVLNLSFSSALAYVRRITMSVTERSGPRSYARGITALTRDNVRAYDNSPNVRI